MTTLPNPIVRPPCPHGRSTSIRDAAVCVVAMIVSTGAPSIAMAACDATCQAQFVTQHNLVRTDVSNGVMPAPGGFQPPASPALPGLSSDNTLAGSAQAWTDACNFGHSGTPNRGENIYATTGVLTPVSSVAAWASESGSYQYAVIGDPVNNGSQVVHYTQIAWANTTLVGCGVTHCTTNSPFGPGSPTWDFAVCQYSPAGNVFGEFPYATNLLPPGGPLDVDGNGSYEPLTDGLLIIRYMFGLRGESLIAGAIGPGARRGTAPLIEAYIKTLMP